MAKTTRKPKHSARTVIREAKMVRASDVWAIVEDEFAKAAPIGVDPWRLRARLKTLCEPGDTMPVTLSDPIALSIIVTENKLTCDPNQRQDEAEVEAKKIGGVAVPMVCVSVAKVVEALQSNKARDALMAEMEKCTITLESPK